jgi:GNAT superfamily N-acetyltransferase
MHAHVLVTPATANEWQAYHRIRREVLFEARGQFGVYDANHPDDRAPDHHPKLLLHYGDPVGVVRVDVAGPVAALRRVAIRAVAQRQGHGRTLLGLVQRFAQGSGCTQLVSCVASDAAAFYEGFGFVVAEQTATERCGSGSVFMTKEIG